MPEFTLRNQLTQGVRIEWIVNQATKGSLIGSGQAITIEADELHPNTLRLLANGYVVLGSAATAPEALPFRSFPTHWGGTWAAGGYEQGVFVRHEGFIWLSLRKTTATPTADADSWMLWANEGDVADHLTDYDNPHRVTAEQTGAVSSTLINRPGGIPSLDGQRLIPVNLFPSLLFDAAVADAHAKRHNQGEDAMLGDNSSYPVTAQELHAHIRAQNNPHNVTITQLQGVPLSLLGQAGGVATLDGQGRIVTSQWPRGIRLTDVYVVANTGLRDALSASLNGGDTVVVIGPPAKTWLWTGTEFVELVGPTTNGILSVNGQTGPTVSLTTANIPESGGSNLYHSDARVANAPAVTALQNKSHDRNKDSFLDYGGPAQVSASNLKNHLTDSNNPHSVTAAQAEAIPERATYRNITGDYVLVPEDKCVIIRVLNTANISLPMDLGDGFQCTIVSVDGHTVTINAGVGNLHSRGNTLNEKMASCVVYFIDPARWEAIGNLV